MLGADFFCSNHLLIDVYTSHIIDAKTYKSVPIWQDETPAPGINACSAGNEFADILKEFPSVTRPQFSTGDVKHSVEHCIPTSGPPMLAKARHFAFIAEYTTDVRHVHGQDNAVADALSRVELGTHPVCMGTGLPSLDLLSMAQAQQADAEVQAYRTAITGLVLADVSLPGTNTTLLCDTSISTARPIVPRSWRQAVFDAIHGLAHPGIKTSQKMVTAHFVWHGISKEVGMWAKTGKGPTTCDRPAGAWPASRSLLPANSCGRGWTSTHFTGQIIPVYHHRPLHTVARGHTNG